MRRDRGPKEKEVKHGQKEQGRFKRHMGSRFANSLDAEMREKEVKDSRRWDK